jgi:hypothetical protein
VGYTITIAGPGMLPFSSKNENIFLLLLLFPLDVSHLGKSDFDVQFSSFSSQMFCIQFHVRKKNMLKDRK